MNVEKIEINKRRMKFEKDKKSGIEKKMKRAN
jgi:hypothetical protein